MAERRIVGFHLDELNDWVAQLECGHNQHVRHNPPWINRPWVTTPEGRAQAVGHLLSCIKCDAGVPPAAGDGPQAEGYAQIARRIATWIDNQSGGPAKAGSTGGGSGN